MEIEIKKNDIRRTVIILVGILTFLVVSYQLYNYLKPVKTIYVKGVPFSFRQDVKKALDVETFPKEELFYDLFNHYRTRNVTMLFKAGSPKTNALYELETIELTYKLFIYDDITREMIRPKKQFNAKEIKSYDNITREENVLKIILVPPEFSDETRVTAGGNRIWIYGKDDKGFDLAVMKAILSIMNVTTLEGHLQPPN